LFDHSTWREVGTPIWIGRSAWPHLSQVLEELQAWWRDTGQYVDICAPRRCPSAS
jgi:hypothetical protein